MDATSKRTYQCQSSEIEWHVTSEEKPILKDHNYLITEDDIVKVAYYDEDGNWNVLVDGWYETADPVAWAYWPEPFRAPLRD